MLLAFIKNTLHCLLFNLEKLLRIFKDSQNLFNLVPMGSAFFLIQTIKQKQKNRITTALLFYFKETIFFKVLKYSNSIMTNLFCYFKPMYNILKYNNRHFNCKFLLFREN